MPRVNYIYYLNGQERSITEISKLLNIERTTLIKRVGTERTYTATIMGYTFKAVRINKTI